MLVIDTHAHLFSADEERYPPRENPSRPPAGCGTIDRLQREMKAAGVRAATAVQVSGFYGFDNRYILDSSKAHPDWIAGVVTLDPDDETSPARLASYANDYGIRGLRSVPAAGHKLDHPGVRELWKFAYEHSLVVNLLIAEDLADEAARLLDAFPELPVALDHCLEMQNDGDVKAKLAALRRLAERPNCHAKLTFIGNGPDGCRGGFPCTQFQDVVMDVIGIFGAERCAWGAHFPLEKYAPRLTYSEHLKIYTEVLPLDDAQRRAIVGETANRLWFRGRLSER